MLPRWPLRPARRLPDVRDGAAREIVVMVVRVISDLVSSMVEGRDGLTVLLAFEVFPDRKKGRPNRFVIQP